WGWVEFDQWLKTTPLEPARKAAVATILADLKGIVLLNQETALAGFSGNLSSRAAGMRRGHSIPLSSGKIYQIDASGEFDTILRIENSAQKQLVTNNDANALASQLNSRLIFLPTQDDSYLVIVSSNKPGTGGKYTLKIRDVVKVGEQE